MRRQAYEPKRREMKLKSKRMDRKKRESERMTKKNMRKGIGRKKGRVGKGRESEKKDNIFPEPDSSLSNIYANSLESTNVTFFGGKIKRSSFCRLPTSIFPSRCM